MKKHLIIFLVFLCPIIVFSQNVEVEGGLIADSIDVQSGLIKNVADPISAQDAATKAYVDLLETTVALLEAKVALLTDVLNLTVQQRLDWGETPIEIYNSDNTLLDSLYGKTYQGGLITYLNTVSGTGLVAAPEDQSTGALWGCFDELIGGTSFLIGTGQANTDAIINGCAEPGIAARLCDDLVYGSYEDWFLPSYNELNELYENLKVNGFGGFSSSPFYSSTEDDLGFDVWAKDFDDGFQIFSSKTNSYSVRAVRAF